MDVCINAMSILAFSLIVYEINQIVLKCTYIVIVARKGRSWISWSANRSIALWGIMTKEGNENDDIATQSEDDFGNSLAYAPPRASAQEAPCM
jgi:hypothetical protein